MCFFEKAHLSFCILSESFEASSQSMTQIYSLTCLTALKRSALHPRHEISQPNLSSCYIREFLCNLQLKASLQISDRQMWMTQNENEVFQC